MSKIKATHCKRGHLRTPENLSRNNCKLCMKEWAKNNPDQRKKISREYSRRWRLKNVYGLTPEKYEQEFNKQKGLCILPSCGQPIGATDHNHSTGVYRGLMCEKHNLALGLFNDNPILLREAAEYLEKSDGKQ